MTKQHAARLASLINDTDFISDLIAARPALSGVNNEEIIANAKKAEGWEECVHKILSFARIQPKKGKSAYVDTSALG